MVKHTQKIRRLLSTNFLSVFDYLTNNEQKHEEILTKSNKKTEKNIYVPLQFSSTDEAFQFLFLFQSLLALHRQ